MTDIASIMTSWSHRAAELSNAAATTGPADDTSNEEQTVENISSTKLTCHKCLVVFNNIKELKFHASCGKIYPCEICDTQLTTITGLKRHRQTHAGLWKYKCDLCGRGFQETTHYIGHMNAHEGHKPYPCRYCNKGFPYNATAKRHERSCKQAIKQGLLME